MTFDEVVRFVIASNEALARAGTDNRARPLIELAYDDWRPFLEDAKRYLFDFGTLDTIAEVQIYGSIIRPKADTIPPHVAFGAALTALPKLSLAAGCFSAVHVTALNGQDPRVKP